MFQLAKEEGSGTVILFHDAPPTVMEATMRTLMIVNYEFHSVYK
jgi:hypothetical protein